jgi:hypothetical protein
MTFIALFVTHPTGKLLPLQMRPLVAHPTINTHFTNVVLKLNSELAPGVEMGLQ